MSNPICPRCGAVASSENARFCGKCRYEFKAPTPAEPAAALPPVAPASQPAQRPAPLPRAAAPAGPPPRDLLGRVTASKPLFFGLSGALGALLGAVLGEIILALLLPAAPPPPPAPPPVDVMFVLDRTSSMTYAMEGVKDGIEEFAEQFNSRGLKSRVGLIAFGDHLNSEESAVLDFGGDAFTSDTGRFRAALAAVPLVDGGDEPESSLDATELASRQAFRPAATKILILITDAAPHIPDRDVSSLGQVRDSLRAHGISQLHIVAPDDVARDYRPLQAAAPGQTFPLDEEGNTKFDSVLSGIGDHIAQATIGGVASTRQFAPEAYWQIVLAISLWTAVLAVGAAAALIFGQQFYLLRQFRFDGPVALGLAGGALAGVLAGGLGQMLFTGGGEGTSARILGWTLLGGCIGWGLSFFVPNLQRGKAAAGGAVGGCVGVLAYLPFAYLLGDWSGRIVGATILGSCIGVMLAIIEIATRRAWIEVLQEGYEKRIVNLGAAPVRVGSRETLELYIRGAAPEAFRFRLEGGRVLRETPASETAPGGTVQEMKDGEETRAGVARLIVRTQAGAEPGRPGGLPPAPPAAGPGGGSTGRPRSGPNGGGSSGAGRWAN